MVHYAANMMVDGAPITNMILNRISILDDMGAWDWNLRLGGFVWFLVFMAIRNIFGKSNGVEWYALAHCLITGIGGVTCAYLTFIMAEEMTGTPEPLAMVTCGGALTSFHRVLPTVTLGYAVIDLLDGMKMGIDFLTHGVVLFTFALYMCENEKNEILSTMLALEFSSIFFNFIRADFLTPVQSNLNLVMFVLSFFLCRIVYGPWSWWQIVKVLFDEGLSEEALACAPTGHRYFVTLSGVAFHLLNGFWFGKILQKMQRKLAGKTTAPKTPVTMKIITTNGGSKSGSSGGLIVTSGSPSKPATKSED